MQTEPLPVVRFSARLSIIVAMCVMIFAVYIAPAFAVAAGIKLSLENQLFISRILIWAATIAIWLYARKKEDLPFISWQDRPIKPMRFIGTVFALLVIVYLVSLALNLILELLHLYRTSKIADELYKTSFAVRLFAVVTAATTEEWLFRGYMMPRLQLISPKPAFPIIVSSLLFALVHIGYGTIANTLIPFFIGLAFAWFYYNFRNLKILIVCHFLIDAISLLLITNR